MFCHTDAILIVRIISRIRKYNLIKSNDANSGLLQIKVLEDRNYYNLSLIMSSAQQFSYRNCNYLQPLTARH